MKTELERLKVLSALKLGYGKLTAKNTTEAEFKNIEDAIEIVKNCSIPDVSGQSELPQLQKNAMNGLIDRAKAEQERKREDRRLIEQVANEKKLSEIILSTDEVKIYTVIGKGEWDVKYPFRSIYLGRKGTWENTNTVSPTLDSAFLVYLQYKHLGSNSQFVDFAMKMLEIPKANEE